MLQISLDHCRSYLPAYTLNVPVDHQPPNSAAAASRKRVAPPPREKIRRAAEPAEIDRRRRRRASRAPHQLNYCTFIPDNSHH